MRKAVKVTEIKNPLKLEREHVQQVYDSIAEHWSGTRYKPWPKVEEFIRAQPKGTLFADIGCGNDFSINLLKVTRQRNAQFEVSAMDITSLPLRSSVFDCTICIAVLHHLSTEDRRLKAIEECIRITKPGGSILFYAWAREQSKDSISRHNFESSCDVFVPWHLKKDSVSEGKRRKIVQEIDHVKDNVEKKSLVLQRFCHVFEKGEWNKLFHCFVNNDSVDIIQLYKDSGNWAAKLRKKKEKS